MQLGVFQFAGCLFFFYYGGKFPKPKPKPAPKSKPAALFKHFSKNYNKSLRETNVIINVQVYNVQSAVLTGN